MFFKFNTYNKKKKKDLNLKYIKRYQLSYKTLNNSSNL